MSNLSAAEVYAIVQELYQALLAFAQEPGDAAYGPTDAAPALLEREGLPSQFDPMNAYYQAGYLHEVTVDNVVAFSKLLNAPTPSIAPFVCVRAAIESSAIATWLADPMIEPYERVARSITFRKEGLIQQKKLANSSGKQTSKGILRRLDDLDSSFTELQNRVEIESKVNRLTSTMPSTTDLVRDNLEMEADYRILSAVAHAHLWALQQVSFRIIRDQEGPHLEKWLDPRVVLYLARLAAIALVIPLRILSKQYGWRSPTISETISKLSRVAGQQGSIRPDFGSLPA